MSSYDALETENFPSIELKDEDVTDVDRILQRTKNRQRISQRNLAEAAPSGKLVSGEVITEALNEESGETSSLVESIFTVSFSKMNETPFKDAQIANQKKN